MASRWDERVAGSMGDWVSNARVWLSQSITNKLVCVHICGVFECVYACVSVRVSVGVFAWICVGVVITCVFVCASDWDVFACACVFV